MKKWTAPRWMIPYLPLIVNTGGSDVTAMMNRTTDPRVNLPLSTLECAVKSQVALLVRMHEAGFLPSPPAATALAILRRTRNSMHELAQSVDLVLTSKQFPKKLRPGMAAFGEAVRRAAGA